MNTAILVDLDNTLIFSDIPSNVLYVRPHINQFLDVLSNLGSLYLCTLGTRAYATKILDDLNITDYFYHVFAREDLKRPIYLPQDTFILIDNEEPAGEAITYKLNAFHNGRVPKLLHVHIPSFFGDPDDELLAILDQISTI
jgi:hypothetical protein